MLRDFLLFNRPLSPHLTVYSSQNSSLFSIWHRFSGIALLSLLFFSLITINLVGFCSSQTFFSFLNIFLNPKIKKLVFLFLGLISIYHSLNGIRHLIWDLGLWLHKVYFIHFTILVILTFLVFIVII